MDGRPEARNTAGANGDAALECSRNKEGSEMSASLPAEIALLFGPRGFSLVRDSGNLQAAPHQF
jgi:hypothetical protein